MGDYTGPLTNEVFKYLDGLRQSEPAFKSLPEPDPTPRSIQIARDFNEHIQAVMNFQGTSEDRLKWEKESFLKLDKRWPHLSVWDKVKGEKRFQEES